MNFLTGLLIGGFAGYQWNQAKHRVNIEKAIQDEATAKETERLHEEIREEAASRVWNIHFKQIEMMKDRIIELEQELQDLREAASRTAEPIEPGGEFLAHAAESEGFENYNRAA